jgi:hypothetical protein
MTGADWRSGHYGADKLAHVFVWSPFQSEKHPACGIVERGSYARTTPKRRCSECLRRMADR